MDRGTAISLKSADYNLLGAPHISSLPKKWVTQHGLKPRDEVRIEWRPSSQRRDHLYTKTKKGRYQLDEIGSEFLYDHLIGAYLRPIASGSLAGTPSSAQIEEKYDSLFRPQEA